MRYYIRAKIYGIENEVHETEDNVVRMLGWASLLQSPVACINCKKPLSLRPNCILEFRQDWVWILDSKKLHNFPKITEPESGKSKLYL